MALVVEDGSGDPDANAYSDVTDAQDYATSHGLAFTGTSDALEAALIRGSQSIDTRYRGSFPGYRLQGREQGLEWPRQAAYDGQGWLIRDDLVPIEIIQASIEAAVRELATPGSMMPDLKRGGAIQSLSAGSVSITYASNASARTAFTIIDGILSGILNAAAGGNGMFGQAVRG